MIYYFDVTETYVKTVGVEAEDLNQAAYRVEELYDSRVFDCGELPREIEFEHISDDIKELVEEGDITLDEIETFLLR